jgi:hypothetical protein
MQLTCPETPRTMAYDLLTALVIGSTLGALHWAIFGF